MHDSKKCSMLTLWGPRRISEVVIAVVAALIGSILTNDPTILDTPPYQGLIAVHKGYIFGPMFGVLGAGHAVAIFLNGRAPNVSRAIRKVACIAHSLLVVYVGITFLINGFPMLATTMCAVLTLIVFALQRTFIET